MEAVDIFVLEVVVCVTDVRLIVCDAADDVFADDVVVAGDVVLSAVIISFSGITGFLAGLPLWKTPAAPTAINIAAAEAAMG